jgi:hypothetical protein
MLMLVGDMIILSRRPNLAGCHLSQPLDELAIGMKLRQQQDASISGEYA